MARTDKERKRKREMYGNEQKERAAGSYREGQFFSGILHGLASLGPGDMFTIPQSVSNRSW